MSNWILRSGSKHLAYTCIPILVAADQVTKAMAGGLFGGTQSWLGGWLRINVVRNHGGFLSLFGNDPTFNRVVLSVLGAIAMFFLICLAFRMPTKRRRLHWGLAMVLGGGFSNWIGRVITGYVVDFIQIGPLPLFNLADLFMMLGILLIVRSLATLPIKD